MKASWRGPVFGAADAISHKVSDGEDKAAWSFIDPCGDIMSLSQEMKEKFIPQI